MADPLAPFGCTLNRLKPGKDGKGLVCSERVALGAPLLALPLSACWTPQAAGKECAVLGEVLAAARSRSPSSELLASDQTWIALHLLQERSRGDGATPLRKSHLALLPKVPESLLAWDDLDIEGLKGSWWYGEAARRKEQAQHDLEELRLELGPAGSEALGLDKVDYLWARQIVDQFGMQVLQDDGSVRTLLVPGVELLQPGPTAPTSTAGARLERGGQGSEATLVFYAEKDYYPGDQVALSHGGLACSNGCRLVGCGWLPESNQWDSLHVSLSLRLDKVPGERDQFGDLIRGLAEGCAAGLADVAVAQPGECLPPHPLGGCSPVQLTEDESRVLCEAVLRFTKERLLPTESTLIHIGAALIADQSKQQALMEMEKDVEGVFNNECCERRALIFLQQELQGALGKYPDATKEGAVHLARAEVEGALPSRSARSLRLMAMEQRMLVDVLTAVQERLALMISATMAGKPAPLAQQLPKAPAALQLNAPGSRAPLLVPLESLVAGGAPPSGTPLSAALQQLAGTTRALEQLTARFLAATAAGKLEASEGAVLRRELGALRSCLEGCPLGDPSAVAPVPTLSSECELVQAHGDATVAALSAQVAALEWERARLEKEAKGGKPANPEPLVRVLSELAGLRSRLLDFEGAHADLKRGLELKPGGLPQALDCAMSLAAQSAEVLAGPASRWSGASQTLKALRERLKSLGYMRAGARWTWPARAPPVKNLASEPAAWGGKDSEQDAAASAQRIKPGTQITKPSREATMPSKRLDPSIMPYVLPRDEHAQDVVGLIRLFMLHKAVPLSRAKELLGADACALLLKASALTCIRSASGQLLKPDEAAALVPKVSPGAADEPEVFSNFALWPCSEDLLVALDFEQATSLEGQFEPVPYLGQDSRALLLGAPSQIADASVLDAFCGSGAQGLAALQAYGKKATFLDPNPRAVRFACFSAHLNGLGDRCTFVEGSLCSPDLPKELKGSKFDVILSSPGTLPNPKMAIANGGPCFARGGGDGERLLAAVVAKGARELLAPNGHLIATGLVANAGGLAARVVGWADAAGSEPADFRAVVFRGEAVRDEEYVHLSTQGCPAASALAHLGALRQGGLRSVSEALVLLRVPVALNKVPRHANRVETLPVHKGLWADAEYLKGAVQESLTQLFISGDLEDGAVVPESLYLLDWSEGTKGDSGSGVPILRPGVKTARAALQGRPSKDEYCITLDKSAGSNLGAQVNGGDGRTLLIEAVLGGLFKDWNAANPSMQVSKGDRIVEINGILGSATQMLEECKQCKVLQVRLRREAPERGPPPPTPAQRGEFVADSARWKDVALHRLLGWAPPALCDWRWFKTALPMSPKQRGTPPTGFVMGMVELKGTRCPGEVKEALRSINCTQRYLYEGEPRTLKPMDSSVQALDFNKILDSYDCLVLPLESGGGRTRPLHELPVEMVYFIQDVSRYVYSTRRPIRLVMLTCGCSGPSFAGMTDDGYGVPAATPLRGIFRCSRIENIQVPILHLDSDALVDPGRGKELAAQVEVELELSAPDAGFYKADVTEQNRAIIHTHREVAYRGGARFLPKLDLCARNPIFPGAKIPPLMGSAAEGVALITGGTGGLGILTAEALVECGVKIIVLSSRSGKISRDYQGLGLRLEALRMSGARIELAACDAKEEKQVEDLLHNIRTNFGPIKWIMNAAGIVLPQDPNLMAPVFEPKCLGAWYFHKHSLTDDIQTFMMYSSMSAGAGANDLSNYAAANTYIDELARLRQSQGLAAVSIMFPEVEEAGMAADMIMQKGNPANIPPGNVRQTIKQVVCGRGPMAPCVAILPQGYLIPRSPTMDSMLEPLKARVDKDLWDRLVQQEAAGKKR